MDQLEEIEMYLNDTQEHMAKAVSHVVHELTKIRAGKANPSMLDGILVSYYGTNTPLSQVASITTPDARSIFIKPWEKNLIPEIEKSIINANLGLTPQNDGQQIILNVPMLTEERRKQLVKQVSHECELGKVSIRNIRKDTNDHIKKIKHVSEDSLKEGEQAVQKLTDEFIAKIDALLKKKEAEIMTV